MNHLEQVKKMAADCNHFAMCKIDYLGTGVCISGREKLFNAYYPLGRMEIVHALCQDLVPVTDVMVDVADTCNLCGICDKQCAFVTSLRPLKVMKHFKAYIKEYLKSGKRVLVTSEDAFLKKLRLITSMNRASNDPAILISYSRDKGLFSERKIPKYIVVPESSLEVSEIIKAANAFNLSYTPRASGASGQGIALGNDLIIDFHKMDGISIDVDGWCATIQPGVTGFLLQSEAMKHGMRGSVAEPSACVCSNILTTRLNSLFSHAYGTGSELIINGEFIDDKGDIFEMNAKGYARLHRERPPGSVPDLCTKLTVRLFPYNDNEEGFLIPFYDFQDALFLLRDMGRKRLGVACGVISINYASFLMSLTEADKKVIKNVLSEKLQINYFLVAIGDPSLKQFFSEHTETCIEKDMFRLIMCGISNLKNNEGLELLTELPSSKKPYESLFKNEMLPLLDMALNPSISNIIKNVHKDLKHFYHELMSQSHMTDMRYLNQFRITSARLGRGYSYFPFIFWISMNDIEIIEIIKNEIQDIGNKYNIRNGFGYCNTLEHGKWALLEFDFFYKRTEEERQQTITAVGDAFQLIVRYSEKEKIKILPTVSNLFKGYSRSESLFHQ